MNDSTFTNENEMRALLLDKLDGRSQTALAEELGMSVQYLNDIIRGRRDVPDGVARKLGYRLTMDRVIIRKYFKLPT